ncbi:hypothetical protein LCGC14_2917040 [marine sediment metagenome]|uniref:Uncharacterized protein n=1 Tax=marine sediment metagenome TaxID=412755 RepID=A0A0F8XQ81_9ZZZZ
MSLLKTSEWKEGIQKFLSGEPSSKDFLRMLDRIATALEVIVLRQYNISLPLDGKQPKDESEVMESVDEVYAQQEVDELMKGRSEEED